MLAGWVVLEARTDRPLVDVRLLRHPTIALANLVMLTAGIGMYLLLSLITRYVQTPSGVGYGFALDTFAAGLVLVPFSILGFLAGKVVPVVRRRVSAWVLLAVSATVILAAFVLFAVARGDLPDVVIAMSLLGLGVGAFSAAMPAVILAVTAQDETASAMGVNQVVRSVGFAVGSAVGGLILAAYTTRAFPAPAGYTAAAWTGAVITAATVIIILALRPAERT
jgi:predicted MFS family arabinose efflux permease